MSPSDPTPKSDDPLDRSLDELLRGAFEPPTSQHFAAVAAGVAADVVRPAPPVWPWRTLWLAAATLLVALLWWQRAPGPHDAGAKSGAALGAMWVAAYDDAARDGSEHPSCCDAGCDLAALCRSLCGQGLNHRDGALDLVGSYRGKPVADCAALVMRAAGETVCVFVVPRHADRGVELPRDRELALSRRELGELVLYSVSPPLAVDTLAGFSLP